MTDEELRKLVEGYLPNAQTLKGIRNIKLLATVGPSATGKTTIAKVLVDASADFHFVLGETSRAIRYGEQPGVDYLFRSRDEIINDMQQGLLVDIVLGAHGDLYSTRLNSYAKNGINIMALMPPALTKYRQLPLKSFQAAFIVPKTYEAWQKWLAARAREARWNLEQRRERLAEAKASHEFALHDKQIRFVLNDQMDRTAQRLWQVSQGQPPDDEATAKTAAKTNYQKLLAQTAP